MRTSRRPCLPAARLAALSAAVGVAALVGLSSTAADATPTSTATSTTTSTTTSTATTTTTTTTTAPTTTTTSTSAASTTAATTTGSSTAAPGPQCPGAASALTPVLCIPAGSGEDQPAPIGTDGELEFAGQVVNDGPDVSDTTIVVTLPAGLQFDPESDGPISRLDQWWSDNSDTDPSPLDCTTTRDGLTSTCSTGAVPAGANFLVLVDVAVLGDPVAGTSGTLTVTLQPTPPDTFPTTTVHAAVDFVGTAHLQAHLTPGTARVTVSHSLTLLATIHNVGPNQAVEAAAVGLVSSGSSFDPPFQITNSAPFPGDGAGSGTSSGSAFLLRALPSAATRKLATRSRAITPAASTAPGPVGYWPIGTIAVGGTETVKIVVNAKSVGQAELDFIAGSADESCDDPGAPGCENTAVVELTAVAPTTTATTAPATTSTQATTTAQAVAASGSSASASSGTGALPNTGFEPMPWLGSAGAAILLGVGLMMLGAPRRRVWGGRHR